MKKGAWRGTGESLAYLPNEMTLREAAERDDVRRAISNRALNALFIHNQPLGIHQQFDTIGDLRRVAWSDDGLNRVPNFGRVSRNQVRVVFGYPHEDQSKREVYGIASVPKLIEARWRL